MLISKVQIRLSVGDGERSSAFYEALLGSQVSRRGETHAVFELDSPPVVLTLEWRVDRLRVAPNAKDVAAHREGLRPDATRSADRGRGPPAARRPSVFVLVVNKPEQVGHAAIALRRAGVRLTLEDQGIEAHDPDGNTWRVRFVPSAASRAVVAA
ncbi:MAG: VOC family protein [Polyangiaceae bacterium]